MAVRGVQRHGAMIDFFCHPECKRGVDAQRFPWAEKEQCNHSVRKSLSCNGPIGVGKKRFRDIMAESEVAGAES